MRIKLGTPGSFGFRCRAYAAVCDLKVDLNALERSPQRREVQKQKARREGRAFAKSGTLTFLIIVRRALEAQAFELLLEAREAAAAVHQLGVAAGPGRVR